MKINKRFQILCATMHQKDFSKIKEMNINSDILYANQSDSTWYKKKAIDGYIAEMITTQTRGLGNNRNIALMYATADICLLADDDVTYYDGYEDKIMSAFGRHPEADMIIFNLDSNSADRKVEIKVYLISSMSFEKKNNPEISKEECIEKSYQFAIKKFGANGYAISKNYANDFKYQKFLNDIQYLIDNKKQFYEIASEVYAQI